MLAGLDRVSQALGDPQAAEHAADIIFAGIMKTTVIITVYNRPAMLIACLRALALSTPRVDEVVVSDDGSSADNVCRMQAAFPDLPFPVHYVRQEDHGYRLAAARNNALRQATGDYIISLDCDILLMPDAVMAHTRMARRGWFLVATVPVLAWWNGKGAPAGDTFPAIGGALGECGPKSSAPHAPSISAQCMVALLRSGQAP